jgi:hypothetical protein
VYIGCGPRQFGTGYVGHQWGQNARPHNDSFPGHRIPPSISAYSTLALHFLPRWRVPLLVPPSPPVPPVGAGAMHYRSDAASPLGGAPAFPAWLAGPAPGSRNA